MRNHAACESPLLSIRRWSPKTVKACLKEVGIFFFAQTKKGKVATKGAKQIVDENQSTLKFYTNMALGAMGIYFVMMMAFFEFTALTIVSLMSRFNSDWMTARRLLNGMRYIIVTDTNSIFWHCICRKLPVHVLHGSCHIFRDRSAFGLRRGSQYGRRYCRVSNCRNWIFTLLCLL